MYTLFGCLLSFVMEQIRNEVGHDVVSVVENGTLIQYFIDGDGYYGLGWLSKEKAERERGAAHYWVLSSSSCAPATLTINWSTCLVLTNIRKSERKKSVKNEFLSRVITSREKVSLKKKQRDKKRYDYGSFLLDLLSFLSRVIHIISFSSEVKSQLRLE